MQRQSTTRVIHYTVPPEISAGRQVWQAPVLDPEGEQTLNLLRVLHQQGLPHEGDQVPLQQVRLQVIKVLR